MGGKTSYALCSAFQKLPKGLVVMSGPTFEDFVKIYLLLKLTYFVLYSVPFYIPFPFYN